MAAATDSSVHRARLRPHSVTEQNDTLRRTFTGGRVMLTAGIATLPDHQRGSVLAAVREFAAFGPDNDPYDEHDFGVVEVEGIRCFWKVEAYHLDLTSGSPDPVDPGLTTRVLTVMLAEEY